MYLNKALIIGNLTRDPELRSLPSGIQVSSFSVATNRVWKDKDGNKQEAAEFHNIVVFGRQAETVSQYLKKGSSVLVEGRLQTRSWESEGVKKYRTEIVADRVQFGPRSAGAGAPATNESADQSAGGAKSGGDSIEYPQEDINPDDIPF
ncbi:MAG: single-stranded DNA-binding protein [Candidatus Pacebacteria bacterium]|jgi:single-strand DNA-binding protein|nr:single-stranded DNA-binding protein [bacterium]MDP6527404.1 single-stranded DNA-binding protein [Candidatus Paceibacterota bacterium]MDP6659530.1 single-stranded DNA-binding protein [Candidatus Paceibacterota bacterium]|tara:strand:- start:18927 stop:19373 length:447 start_codon:yes stop_codon:yes gene_type:complete